MFSMSDHDKWFWIRGMDVTLTLQKTMGFSTYILTTEKGNSENATESRILINRIS